MNMELKALINNIRDLCPKLRIDESSIIKPTPEFVLRFYSHILMEFEYNLLITISIGVDDNDREDTTLEPEQIYRQLSKILSQPSLKFRISDIYEPNFVRTKSFLRVFAHFYSFSLSLMDNIEQQTSDILMIKENMKENLSKKRIVSEIVSDNAMKKAMYDEESGVLDEDLKSLEKEYLEIEEQKVLKAKNHEAMRRQNEILTQEVEIENSNLENMLSEREHLIQETVSDEEYKNIMKMIESLENHMKTMNSDPDENEDNFLTIARDALEHLRDCRNTLPDSSELRSLEAVETLMELRKILTDLKFQINKLMNKGTISDEKVEQAIKQLNTASNDYNGLKKAYEQEKLQISERREKIGLENTKSRKQIRKECSKIREDIENKEALFSNTKSMQNILLKLISSQYNKLLEAQSVTFTNSYLMLDEIAKLYK